MLSHHASLRWRSPSCLGYRFALADLFLKNAIALLLWMGLSLAVFFAAMAPLLRWPEPGVTWDPRSLVLFLGLWMATSLTFPVLRRLAVRLVDRVVLRRPDYDVTLSAVARGFEGADSEDAVIAQIVAAAAAALGVVETRRVDDPVPHDNRRVVITAPELRTWIGDSGCTLLVRLRTVDPPHAAVAFGPLAAGRRLLSDDLYLSSRSRGWRPVASTPCA